MTFTWAAAYTGSDRSNWTPEMETRPIDSPTMARAGQRFLRFSKLGDLSQNKHRGLP